jgi:hypothetical protein
MYTQVGGRRVKVVVMVFAGVVFEGVVLSAAAAAAMDDAGMDSRAGKGLEIFRN